MHAHVLQIFIEGSRRNWPEKIYSNFLQSLYPTYKEDVTFERFIPITRAVQQTGVSNSKENLFPHDFDWNEILVENLRRDRR